jgi:Flp pilus assembly protein TadG
MRCLAGLSRHLRQSESGSIMIMMGLLLVPLIGLIGLSVDTARAYAVQRQLQVALDAAALAGGRNYSIAERDQIIQDYFNENWAENPIQANATPVVIVPDLATGTLTVTANATLDPLFVKFIGVGTVEVGASAQIVRNDTTLEVALVIDTTGSMDSDDDNGDQKMGSAISAANLLLNILYNYQDTDDHVYVSVVPFVQNVNVGTAHSSWLVSGSQAAVPWNAGPYPTSTGWRGCVFERLDGAGQVTYDTTDEPPTTQLFRPYADSYFGPNCPVWTTGERGVTAGLCRQSNGYIFTATNSGTSGATAPTYSGAVESCHTSTVISDGTVNWQCRRPTYGGTGVSAVDCPIWQRNETISGNGVCRFAPVCSAWATGQSISIGDCRTSGTRIYSATTSGTTTGGSGPSHTSGTTTSGGISWQYRSAAYVGVGNNFYVSTGITTPPVTTGNAPPVHTSGTVSDGNINWQLVTNSGGDRIGRMWSGGQSISSTGTGNMRVNPWYFWYDPRNTNTTSGSTPPTHTSGTVTTGSIQWRYQGRLTAQDAYYNAQYGHGYNSGCGTPIVPMTDNRLTAKATVDVLHPSTGYGGTMTSMGLIWGWRSISPRWQGLWNGVPADRPYAYNQPDNYKAVILLTDGENVFSSCNGTFCRSSATPYGYLADGRLGTTDSATAVSTIDSKVTTICNNIRATGTLIYAVMFDLPAGASDTRTLFQNCTGSTSRFFDVVDEASLTAAFQTIAIDLSRLRISQ